MDDERTTKIPEAAALQAESPPARTGPFGISRRAWLVTLLSLGGWMLVNADGSLFNFAYPLIQQDLGISDTQISYVYATIYLVGAVATFIAGPAMDRFGRKPIYQLCLFAAVAGSVLTAGATSFLVLIIARGITQGGAATEWMAGQVMVAEEAPSHARGRLIGFAQIGYPLGFFLGSLLSLLVIPTLGWRVLFLFGLLPIIMMIFARRKVDETERFKAEYVAEHDGQVEVKSRYRQLLAPDLRRSSILIGIWHLVYAFGVAGIISYLPNVDKHFGVSLEHTYASSAIATAVAAVGYIVCSLLGEKIGRREASAAFLIIGSIAGAFLAFKGENIVLLTLFFSLVYFFTIGHITAAAGFAAEVFPTRVRGTGANIIAGMEWLGFVAAALAGPIMFESLGYATTLIIWLCVCPLIAAACALGMRRVAPGAELEEISR
jgi:MFS family permease